MELTKENVYIYLRGKSKEELTELKNILVEFKQNAFRVHLISYYYENQNEYNYFHFVNTTWLADSDFDLVKDKTEVTIEQLKDILQPMENKEEKLIEEAKRRGFLREGNEFYSCFDDRNKIRVIKPYDSNSKINLYLDCVGYLRYYDGLNNEYDCSLCSNPAIYKDGVWAEIVSESLEQQLQKAEAEVKRLQSLIEEENIPKIGDWVKNKSNQIFKYCNWMAFSPTWIKITDQELISKLNELIK